MQSPSYSLSHTKLLHWIYLATLRPVGNEVGFIDTLGSMVGKELGENEGSMVGCQEGSIDGALEGVNEGSVDAITVGESVVTTEGIADGIAEGVECILTNTVPIKMIRKYIYRGLFSKNNYAH